MVNEKKFFSTTELAKLMGISRIAVYKKIKAGEIKARRSGRNFVIGCCRVDVNCKSKSSVILPNKFHLDAFDYQLVLDFLDFFETH